MHRVLVLTCLVLIVTEARADDAANVNDAAQLMKEGRDLFARSRFEQARERFAKACEFARTSACISGLAITELRAGRPLDAYRHFQQVLRDPHVAVSVPAATLDVLPKLQAEAYAQIGHVEVDAPPGASVRLDGALAGVAPLETALDVNAGEHVIEAERGTDLSRVSVATRAGQIMHADLTFAPTVPPASVPLVPVAAAPSSAPAFPVAPGVPFLPGASPPFWTPGRRWGAVFGGTGLVAMGVGGLFGVLGQNAADRAGGLRASLSASNGNGSVCGVAPSTPGCSSLEDAYGEQSRDRALSIALFAAGGAAVLAGTLLLLWAGAQPVEGVAIVPAFEAHGGLVQLRGEL